MIALRIWMWREGLEEILMRRVVENNYNDYFNWNVGRRGFLERITHNGGTLMISMRHQMTHRGMKRRSRFVREFGSRKTAKAGRFN